MIPTHVLLLVSVIVDVPDTAGVNTNTSSSAVVYEVLPQVTELVAVISLTLAQVVLLMEEYGSEATATVPVPVAHPPAGTGAEIVRFEIALHEGAVHESRIR